MREDIEQHIREWAGLSRRECFCEEVKIFLGMDGLWYRKCRSFNQLERRFARVKDAEILWKKMIEVSVPQS